MIEGFSWSQFLWVVFVFVGVPSLFFGLRLWRRSGREDDGTGTGRLGLWATGSVAFVFGFVSCAGWLTWSADQRGEFRGVGLPAPNEFPTWQVLACAATVVVLCWLAAALSRRAESGGWAAALGTTAGFSTAFAVEASMDVTGQSGVGVAMCVVGLGVSLSAVMWVRNTVSSRGWKWFVHGS